MLFSVDRIEGTQAVLIDELGKPLGVPLSMLPKSIKNGDMVLYQNEQFALALKQTTMRRETMAGVLRQLLRHGDEEREIINHNGSSKKGDSE